MINRKIANHILEIHQYFPIVYLGGPRQSGKTTLLKSIYSDLPHVNLEEPDSRKFALEDPRRFLSLYAEGAILDEIQRVPELFSYLQSKVDDHPKLKFVLSGSQNFLLMEQITQSLAGRVGILNLFPFEYSELLNVKSPNSLEDFTWQGGYPAIYDRNIPPKIYFNNYVQTYLERDVREIRQVGNLASFHRFLLLCAARAGQLVNLSSLASDAGIAVNTAKEWLSILEASWIIFLLQPYYRNFSKRLRKSPKLYFYDTGLLSQLLNINDPETLHTHFAYGALIENAVIAELIKQRMHMGEKPECYFFRDSNGNEVDLLIEEAGKIISIEIKASHTPHPNMTKGLKYWQDISGEDATNSYVVYGGSAKHHSANGNILPWNYAFQEI